MGPHLRKKTLRIASPLWQDCDARILSPLSPPPRSLLKRHKDLVVSCWQFELIHIAADERDVIRVGTNFRKGENVRVNSDSSGFSMPSAPGYRGCHVAQVS